MRSIELTEEIVKAAQSIINIPLPYKKLMNHLGQEILSGKSKICQIEDLKRAFNIEIQRKPTRYIIKEIYDTKQEKNNKKLVSTNKQDFLDLCERRYLTPVEEIPEHLHSREKVAYICDFHPDTILHTTLRNLKNTIGCPLCQYPMSRFEVMVFLGLEHLGAIHRAKLKGVEYDIYIPKQNILIEADGILYHSNDEENGRAKRKYKTAEELNCTLYKLVEQTPKSKIYCDDNKIYTVPFLTASLKERQQMIDLLKETFAYDDSQDYWDKAADYMREWKNQHQDQENNNHKKIYQYDTDGNLIHTFNSFKEIQDTIKSGQAFGFNWAVT